MATLTLVRILYGGTVLPCTFDKVSSFNSTHCSTGNLFALRDGRIAYVDFGNVAELSQRNKEVLIDAVVHAVNKDYEQMAYDFIKLVRTLSITLCDDQQLSGYEL